MCQDISVGIVTRYVLDGPMIESRYDREFPQMSRPALGSTQPPVQWVPRLLSGVKQPRRGADHRPPSSAKAEERVELYLYFPSAYLHQTSAERHYVQIYNAEYLPNRAMKLVRTN